MRDQGVIPDIISPDQSPNIFISMREMSTPNVIDVTYTYQETRIDTQNY